MGAGSFLKGKPGGVMERISFKVDTGEGCVCWGVITLNSLVFGSGICAFVTRNSSDMALDMLTMKLWVQCLLSDLEEGRKANSSNVWARCGRRQEGLLALDNVLRASLNAWPGPWVSGVENLVIADGCFSPACFRDLLC
eukprot:704551-Pelagomonas_calceolata.AAC.1